MKIIFLLSLLIFQSPTGGVHQTQDDLALQKISLISEIQALEAKAGQLDKPLALAAAKAEIADAAWTLDKEWAQRLLREAYKLTFPSEAVRAKLRQLPVGVLYMPTELERAAWGVRSRVMSIASRDKDFAEQLAQLGAKQLGRLEEHTQFSELAKSAAERGDAETAARHIRQAFGADPTQFQMWEAVFELALKDRAAADNLVVQYLESLKTAPLSYKDASLPRVLLALNMYRRPSPTYFETGGREIAPPGPAVERAYMIFMLDLIERDERRSPGSVRSWREILLWLWRPINKYAPELIPRFKELELLSRTPGQEAPWPPPDVEAIARKQYKERMKALAESEEPDETVIGVLIDRGEFGSARRLLDKMADGSTKSDLLDKANAKEAVSLLRKGDITGAQVLAARIKKATYILQAYPPIIEKCLSKKDAPCATNTVYQATRQIKQSDVSPPAPPPGVPASALATGREFDPVLSALCRFVQILLPVDDALASEVLNEMVAAANASEVDTGQGRAGFDAAVFKAVARRDEPRARQAALSLKDPLRQVVSLAAVYRWKADELGERAKAAR